MIARNKDEKHDYHIPGNFHVAKFFENGDFNNFAKNIFTNDSRGQHKRRGMAIFCEIQFCD